MTGSAKSVSRTDAGNRVLVCGLNWVGDSIMCMPALQALREQRPEASIDLLVKPGMAPLWNLHEVPDTVLHLEPGLRGIRQTARTLKTRNYDETFVLPHSLRSTLLPYLARIPRRAGLAWGFRDRLLTRVVHLEQASPESRRHQAYEYYALMAPEAPPSPPSPPRLSVPPSTLEAMRQRLPEGDAPLIGMMPGAARGPSKQWPEASFKALADRLRAKQPVRLALFGSPDDQDLCERLAQALPGAVSFAGRTSFADWAAGLASCDVVVANDSGGMHLAAALNRPVVAMFGITDPESTGPLGSRVTLLQHSSRRTRDVPRDCPEARQALAAISPDEALQAVCAWLERLNTPEI